MNQILVIVVYRDQPMRVQKALKSIVEAGAKHPEWLMAFYDDASKVSGTKIVHEIMGGHRKKFAIYRNTSGMQSDTYLGRVMNQIANEIRSDITIVLRDRDVLHPYYFKHLNDYFSKHSTEACHCHTIGFDPSKGDAYGNYSIHHERNHIGTITGDTNATLGHIAWKTRLHHTVNLRFQTSCKPPIDNEFIQAIRRKAGPIPFMKYIGQYEAIPS